MLYYLIWMPLASMLYMLYAWLLLQNKSQGGNWFWFAAVVGAVPLWLVISHWSKNMFFDGMLYDAVMFLSYALATAYFMGRLSSLQWTQWLGMILIIVGFFLVRLGEKHYL